MYNDTGCLIGYNIGPIPQTFNNRTIIEEKLIGKEITVVFSKRKILTEEENETVIKRRLRTPSETIVEYKFIPKIK